MKRVLVLTCAAVLAGACSHGGPAASPSSSPDVTPPVTPTESAVAPEHNPPGDIPDSQVFVEYRSTAGHFAAKVPEGWGRTSTGTSVTFTDKLNAVSFSWQASSSAPTEESVRRDDVPNLRRTERAFRLIAVASRSLPAGRVVLVTFRRNSEPNAVTGRQYRDDVLWFAFYRSGTEVILELSSPVGADNVDPWRTISQSVRWI